MPSYEISIEFNQKTIEIVIKTLKCFPNFIFQSWAWVKFDLLPKKQKKLEKNFKNDRNCYKLEIVRGFQGSQVATPRAFSGKDAEDSRNTKISDFPRFIAMKEIKNIDEKLAKYLSSEDLVPRTWKYSMCSKTHENLVAS